MSNKVLVTGATGFLGSYIVDSYVKRGIPVRAMARKTSNLSWLQAHLDAGKAELVYGTMTDHASLHRAVHGVNRIVHVAAVIGPDIPLHVYQEVNVEGTRVLLDAAVAEGVERFTLISSVSVYGYGYTPGGIVTEETPQLPSNPYGASKLAQQELAFEAYRQHGLPVVAIEPPVIRPSLHALSRPEDIDVHPNILDPFLEDVEPLDNTPDNVSEFRGVSWPHFRSISCLDEDWKLNDTGTQYQCTSYIEANSEEYDLISRDKYYCHNIKHQLVMKIILEEIL
jgi:NAD(P)-dependent dehydrogenase (short-subunit alcohol dehydrogenase family)